MLDASNIHDPPPETLLCVPSSPVNKCKKGDGKHLEIGIHAACWPVDCCFNVQCCLPRILKVVRTNLLDATLSIWPCHDTSNRVAVPWSDTSDDTTNRRKRSPRAFACFRPAVLLRCWPAHLTLPFLDARLFSLSRQTRRQHTRGNHKKVYQVREASRGKREMGSFRSNPVAVAAALALAASSAPSGVTFVDGFVVPPSASAIARSTHGAVRF